MFYYFQRFEISTLCYKGGLIEGKFAVLVSARNSFNLEWFGVPKVEVDKTKSVDWHSPLPVKCRLHESTKDPHCPAFEVASIRLFCATHEMKY